MATPQKFHPTGGRYNTLDSILAGENGDDCLNDPLYFSSLTSKCDVLDIGEDTATMHAGIDDDQVRRLIRSDISLDRQVRRTRLVFIDSIQHDPERLPVTSALFRELLDAYGVSSRFTGFLRRQHMPGRNIRLENGVATGHEMWYSAVVRSTYNHSDKVDLSRKVMDWTRYCVHSSLDLTTGQHTMIILRCPSWIKTKFFETFRGDKAQQLRDHPMLTHAFLIENIMIHTYDFLQNFSDPLYTWEAKNNDGKYTAEDYTQRSQTFLSLSRQIQQVATDYDILVATINHLKREHTWLENSVNMMQRLPHISGIVTKDVFDWYLEEVKLIRTYSSLYEERTKIGVSEGFAMVNQKDAEVNLKMSAESTQIARASFNDGQALRFIQIMSMFFLPASLVSSIFGMGFFSTDTTDTGAVRFNVSNRWWLYIAVSVPVTGVIMLGWLAKARYERSKDALLVDVDLETGRSGSNAWNVVNEKGG